MIEFEKPNIKCLEIDKKRNYAKFICEPLERGYGITIGNSLRRILLSSLPGAAITSVKIEGVEHEFTTIPHVVEDVTEIILNLKMVRLKFDDSVKNDEEKYLRVSFKGEGELTAGDIITDGTVEILNPDLHIATVGKSGKIDMGLTAERGRGYNTAEMNKHDDEPIGVIAIDSIFSPVKKVNYSVENTRVGQMVDYDKLTIELWTDGSLDPSEALSLAAKVLTEHVQLFVDLSEATKDTQIMKEKEVDEEVQLLEKPIDVLELSVRSFNGLRRSGIDTIGKLTSKTAPEMAKIKNLGKKSLEEVITKLHEMGLDLKNVDDQ